MEPHTQTDDTPDSRSILEGQLRECFGRVVYSHKTHEKCADILLSRLSRIKLWQIILSAVTTVGFIAAVFGAGRNGALVGILVSTALLVLNAYTKNYDLGELSQKHRLVGADLWIIREKYLSLITDLRMGEKPIETLQAERDALLEELHSVYSSAPSTTYQAYRKAQEALKQLEDMTFSDAEIDAFLPKTLKKG
ncbi:MAG: SLATT domain-containing protein [Deltaproteobacteria bacterium]|nr:SLATT domain-containing protein [Deltaproteobacteria bacterium]